MQWLIDMVTEKVLAEIGIPPVFVDRGDPAVADWTEATLTINSAWHDLDLSTIVPEGASTVLFNGYIRDDAVNSYFFLRSKDNAGLYNISAIITQVANVPVQRDMVVKLTSDRKISYTGFTGTDFVSLTVRGWWL